MRFPLAAILLACVTSCYAQQTMNNEMVLKMHSAGLSDDLIVTAIAKDPGVYSTGAMDMINLKSAGLSDQVIAAMAAKNGPSATETKPVETPKASPSTTPSGKPRVFLTSVSHGSNQNAARDQSMELAKDFERDCVDVKITLNQAAADYTVSLNHIEVGLFVRDNQFQIADHSGDLIGKTKEGGSIAGGVKKACALIVANWTQSPHLGQ